MIHAPLFQNADGSIEPCTGLRVEVARLALLCVRCSTVDLRLKAGAGLTPDDAEHLRGEGYVLTIAQPLSVAECLRDDDRKPKGDSQ
jgi:hypothetical protein